MVNSNIGTSDLSSIIDRSLSFCRYISDDVIVEKNYANTTAIFKEVGEKVNRKWSADRFLICDKLIELLVIENEGPEIKSLTICPEPSKKLIRVLFHKSDEGIVVNEFKLRLLSELKNDKESTKRLKQIEKERDEKQRIEINKARDEGKASLLNNVKDYRRDIKTLSPYMNEFLYSRSDSEWIEEIFNRLRSTVEGAFRKRAGNRSGNVDYLVNGILRSHNLYNIWDVPELISETGVLIDSKDCLAVLQVQDDYLCKVDKVQMAPLFIHISSGYRPHINIVRELPRSYYDHPGYYAPIEDLFDHFAIEFYAGKKAGNAEDCAVGWLIQFWREEVRRRNKKINIEELSSHLEYWSTERLKECEEAWEKTGKPALTKLI